jgi:competence protein ComEA
VGVPPAAAPPAEHQAVSPGPASLPLARESGRAALPAWPVEASPVQAAGSAVDTAPTAGLAGMSWPQAAESGLAAPAAGEPVPLLTAASAAQIEPRPVTALSAGGGRPGRAGPDGPPVGGAWARWANRWLPDALVAARLNPGRRAAAVLLLVALAGAALAAGLAWRTRPAAVPVTAPALAAGPSAASPGGAAAASKAPAPVVVAVAGRVRRPGVVRLPAGARVIDAVRAAGGALPRADLGLLNLARRLSDGELVVVGVPGQPAGGPPAGSPSSGGGPGTAGTGPVDLNTATAEQLDALPGVGPVLAQRIVEWRAAHGRFDSVAQLQDVDGIGTAKFAQLRDRVTV